MLAVKYLHEFAHFIYSNHGRLHLLNAYNVQLKDSIQTPDGILRGESGNKFEEQMLGFVLSYAGHANIAMNVSYLNLYNKVVKFVNNHDQLCCVIYFRSKCALDIPQSPIIRVLLN